MKRQEKDEQNAGRPEPLDPYCSICGDVMECVECWHCQGAGGFHDCGDDCCCCLYPEDDLNRPCPECNGSGDYLECPNVPHDAT